MNARLPEPRRGKGRAAPAAPARPWQLEDRHAIVVLGIVVAVFFRELLLSHAYLWEDFLIQSYPFRRFAAVSLMHGELPLWNPYAYAGMPFQADIQSALFYLPNLLLTPLLGGQTISMYWMEVLLIAHVWLAGVGMYFLARELELERPYALFSGLLFSLSGFMIAHAIHPGFVEQAAWFPVIVLLTLRATRRHSLGYAIGAGLLLGHAILAGAPQISLYLFLLLSLVMAVEIGAVMRAHGVRAALGVAVLGGVIAVTGIGIAAIQVLPTLELAPLSQRAEISFEASQDARLPWQQLLTAVVPKFFGDAGPQGSTFWGPGAIHGSYWETCFYWGIPGLIAACAALAGIRRDRRIAALTALVVFAFMLAVGDQFILHRLFFEYVPGFSKFRAVARITLLATFAVALLGGFGARSMLDAARARPRAVEAWLAGAVALMAFLWLMVRREALLPSPSQANYDRIVSVATHETGMALLLVCAVAATGVLLTRRVVSPSVAMAVLLVLQYVDITRFGASQNAGTVSADDYYRYRHKDQERLVEYLKQDDAKEFFRVTVRRDANLMLDRNQGFVDQLSLTEGYTPLALRRSIPPARSWDATYDLLNSKYRIVVDESDRTMGIRPVTTYYPRAWVTHDVAVVTGDSAVASFMRSDTFDARRTAVLEQDPGIPPQPPITSPDTLAFGVYHLNSYSIDVATSRDGMLMMSEIWYPGWNAYVDGAPVPLYRADWSLRAVPIHPGVHHVEVRFQPASFRIGAGITAATLLAALGTLIGLRVRRRREA